MTGIFVQYGPGDVQGRIAGWIEDGSGCHIWIGGNNGKYGVVRVERRMRYIHRVRYSEEVGPIPRGLQLDHFACNEPLCCNPAHLRPVTARENLLRSNLTRTSINRSKTSCKRGHPLSGDNLRVDKLGHRHCRACLKALKRGTLTDVAYCP